MENNCPQCETPVQNDTAVTANVQEAPVQPAADRPVKSRVAAGVLAILLGDIGVHKFYLGQIGKGILFLLFCWTGIPGLIGLIQGIRILCSSNEQFEQKYNVRAN